MAKPKLVPVSVTQDHIDRGEQKALKCALSLAIGEQYGAGTAFKVNDAAMVFIKVFDEDKARVAPQVIMMERMDEGAYAYRMSRITYGKMFDFAERV